MREGDKPDTPGDGEPSAGALSEAPTITRMDGDVSDEPPAFGRLSPGQQFGSYEIIRLLGKGGMGEVYEAYDSRTERHIALKALNERLSSETDRARFLREGRLAAQVSHPNSVFVFGTEELDGQPLIIMELAPSGTLKSQVKADGPMDLREAVDAVLQLLGGLEASAAGGVLHRDIKPSNCFVWPDGTTKIGDFGLSISTLARDETQLTASGSMVGTPAFASPEQLSGRALDLRADIYSLGATLFYLLAGQPPFVGDRPVELIARVLAEQPLPLRELAPTVPRALERVVARCLSKDAGARFGDYAALRHALARHGSGAPRSARVQRRVAATSQDVGLVLLADVWIRMDYWGALVLFTVPRVLGEGLWGKSPGKHGLGLRVIGLARPRAGLLRALIRNVALVWPLALPTLLSGFDLPRLERTNPGGVVVFSLDPVSALAIVAWPFLILFAMRARQGIAPHDWIAGMQVIPDPLNWEQQYRAPENGAPPPPVADDPHVGPYRVLERRSSDEAGTTYLAHDDTLKRRLWVRVHDRTSQDSAAKRPLDKRNALRWINGRRTAAESWDAWEYLPGETPQSAACRKRRWRDVRAWLHSLARDLRAASSEGTPGPVRPANLWLSENGRTIVADFPFEDYPPDEVAAADRPARHRLLASVCISLLQGCWRPVPEASDSTPPLPLPLPLHARTLLDALGNAPLSDDEAVDRIQRSCRLAPDVSVGARCDIVASPGFVVLFGALALFLRERGLDYLSISNIDLNWLTTEWPGLAAKMSQSVLAVGLTCLAGAFLMNWRLTLGNPNAHWRASQKAARWLSRNEHGRGYALVDARGRELRRASKPLLVRTLVAWIPAWVAGLLLAFESGVELPESVWLLPPVLLVVGGLHAIRNPTQAIQDRIAGTYLVPR